MPSDAETLHHHLRRMDGRDPHEAGRVSTPLETLFDLTFATCFSLAAAEFSNLIAAGRIEPALLGFGFASFAICWAWINFSWFSSAYDTDDWIFRLVTMVQMIGVLILAIGLPRMFASLGHGDHPDNATMVLGYVVMRVALVTQWLRAARQDPARRRACLAYAIAVSIAQVGWVAAIFVPLSSGTFILATIVLALIEFAGPYLAEKLDGGTPWHAHHIAERNSLFVIIALGESVVGTVATLSAVVQSQGWTPDAALVAFAGIGLTFGIWWVYDVLPSGPILHAHRERSFVWGYGHMLIVVSIVATGAGLHVAADYIEDKAEIGALATLLAVAIPVASFIALIYGLYVYLVRQYDRIHTLFLALTALTIAIAIVAAASGIDMAICLALLTFAPAISVIGYELLGYRHQAEALEKESHRSAE